MAMGTERSKALHNFTLPCGLRWGNQRFLRCMKVNNNNNNSRGREKTNPSASSSQIDHHHQFVHNVDGSHKLQSDDDGIAAIREKVMLDLQTAADKMKDAIFNKDGAQVNFGSVSPVVAERPWNLRTRRAASRTTPLKNGGGSDAGVGKSLRDDGHRPSFLHLATAPVAAEKSLKLKSVGDGGDGDVATASGEKRERAKFSVALSKREIEEDFLGVFGHRPPRRPKKRARTVQKELDTLFPGLWLTEVTPDKYKVPETIP